MQIFLKENVLQIVPMDTTMMLKTIFATNAKTNVRDVQPMMFVLHVLLFYTYKWDLVLNNASQGIMLGIQP